MNITCCNCGEKFIAILTVHFEQNGLVARCPNCGTFNGTVPIEEVKGDD